MRDGSLISSIMYRIRKDGRAIIIKIMAGKIVQTVSTSCASMVLVWVSLCYISEYISTSELIRKHIVCDREM